ncbi:MAG TPA: hypothetical protein VK974_00620 [Methylophilaceae bacterium]|nr:hypothetical protein [Methylophilaceae bacterium]
MQRMTRATAVAARPAAPAPGAPGYATGGNPGGVPATVPGYEWYNGIQETLMYIIEQMGLAGNHADDTLLYQAIKRMIDGGDYKPSCRVASTATVNIAAPGANIDGIAMVAGDRALLKDQAAGAQNGFYIWNGAAVPMTRSADADTAAELNSGVITSIEQGTANADTVWLMTTDGVVIIGTTALSFANITGLTIATADARYMGIGYMMVRDEKAQGTTGGAASAGVNTRTLNTVSSNTIVGASLGSNQITLPAGTYRIDAGAPGYAVDRAKAYLYNVTDAVITIVGNSSDNTTGIVCDAIIRGRFTIAAPKVFEIRHVFVTSTSDSLGTPSNTAGLVEVYTHVQITKES